MKDITYRCAEWVDAIEKYIDTDPTKVAMATRNSALASSIKYLQRAKGKLPSHYLARCYITQSLFEQSSSEAASLAKFEGFSGLRAVDLTCGLGVDSFALAQKFQRVDTVEISSEKAEIATYNFKKLGAENITVHNTSAEDFIATLTSVDLIYLDPSRVKDGKKVYSLEDSSPNIVELLPKLLTLAPQVLVKLSPLYDVEECFRVFGDTAKVSVLSSDNECKEVLVLIERDSATLKREIEHIILARGTTTRLTLPYGKIIEDHTTPTLKSIEYIYVPDVAFYKARTVEALANRAAQGSSYLLKSYLFSSELLRGKITGQSYRVNRVIPYKPRLVKEYIKSQGIKGLTIHLKNFPYTISKIKKELSVKEGGDCHLFCAEIYGEAMLFFAEKIF